MDILVNAFGISNAGGIRVFDKLLGDLSINNSYNYHVVCNKSLEIDNLIIKYASLKNIYFIVVVNKGIFYRLFYENFTFRSVIHKKNIQLVYNFSGTYQFFLDTPQILKIQNLLFFCKKLDSVYFSRKYYSLWLKQVFLKRLILKYMLKKSIYIEVQSDHVIDCLSDFVNIKTKDFFVKNDFDVSKALFTKPKKYDFSKKIKFLYIVGPHFETLHKNFLDFVNSMIYLDNQGLNFEIDITLTSSQLAQSSIWDLSLNSKTNFLGYISNNQEINELHCDNVILISTSVIETLGLHVLEAIRDGLIVITPNESYADSVYGENVVKYDLFNYGSLQKTIMNIINYRYSHTDRILTIQDDLIKSETSKYQSNHEIFDRVVSQQK
jgi:hypothetical protein